MIHEHSIAAYREERPKLSARQAQVFEWLKRHGGATDREIMIGLNFFEMNTVRPRVTELIHAGLLREIRETQCAVTGKTVRVVDVAREAPVQLELLK